MQKLETTTPGPNGHHHISYINSETGVGAMSAAPDGHTHELIYDPPRPPREPALAIPPQVDPMTGQVAMVQDPQTGQMIPDPGTPEDPGDPGKETGEWIVSPGGEDMHEHELIEYVAKVEKKKESDKEIIDDCLALWREGLGLVSDCRKKGRESEDFYKGKQWDDEVSRSLLGLDRAALTINEIMGNIDTLIGYQMEQRTDWRFLPREGGDQRVADMLNVVVKQIADNCYYSREETKVFKDICVPGMGAFNAYMDYLEDIQGVIKVERFPWDDIVYGPHEKEDLSDCEYEVRSRMQSIAMLKMKFGKKAEEIEGNFRSYSGQYPDSEKGDNGVSGEHTDYRYARKVDDNYTYTLDGSLPLVDVQKKQFRLAQCTRKIYKEVTVLFNQEENFFFTAYDWKDKDIAAASTIPGFQVISQMKPRMRVTKFCGTIVLSDENPADLPIHDFFTVPVYGYRQNGEFWGKVEVAKDPQREINKRRSQIMDQSNRMGGSVYYVEPTTFKDNNELERFKKNRSKPGSVFTANNIDRTPKLEEGAEVPSALVTIMQMDQANLQRLLNIVVQQDGANESGALFLEKKKGRLTGNQFLFDNLSFAKQKLGKLIVALIQRYYDAERLQRLLNAQYSKAKFKVGEQDYATFSKEEIIEMLENADLLDYDVVVTESSFSASTRIGIAKVLFELISQGAQIPPELPLEFVDMPSDTRQRITERLEANSQQQAQAAADTSNSEIAKTAVAQGTYTISPEKAAELGLVPVNAPLPNAEAAPNTVEDNSQATEYANNLASALAG